MFHVNSHIATGLILVASLSFTAAFAETDIPSSYSAVIGGRISAQTNLERKEMIRLRYNTGNPIAGKEKSQLCQGCHGEFGDSTDPLIPKLAGQRGNYISKQIRNYQAGARTHEIMDAMAMTVSDDDLADIAAYFASQNKMKGDGSAENQLGKKLFLNGGISKMALACVNCHGERGNGIESPISAFPVIGGQYKDYIRQQLINFRDGNRTNSPYNIMNRIAGSLTDTEIESLAEYISVQPPGSPAESILTPVDHRDQIRKSRSK
jgi:cytochrome c553